MSIPKGYYGRIVPRSGLSIKAKIDIGAGVIDPDYRGEIYPVLINNSSNQFHINVGDRIVQIVFTRTDDLSLEELDDLDMTKRGIGEFGSSDSPPDSNSDKKIQASPLHSKLKSTPQKITVKLP